MGRPCQSEAGGGRCAGARAERERREKRAVRSGPSRVDWAGVGCEIWAGSRGRADWAHKIEGKEVGCGAERAGLVKRRRWAAGLVWFLVFFPLFLFYSYFKPNLNHLNSNLNLNSNHTQSIKLCTSMNAQQVKLKINFNYLWNKN